MRRQLVSITLLALFLLSSLALVPAPAAADNIERDGTIYYDSYERLAIGSYSDSYSGKIKVTTNASVDVYLLTSTYAYSYPESFVPTKTKEKTMKAEFSFTAKAGETYYVIIDNTDNSRSTDAVPTGSIAYQASYPNVLDQLVDDVGWAARMCMIWIILIVVIIVVVVVLIIYFVTRKPKTPPQQQYPPAYQQPYQPPPAQAGYQQQPGYQPPPPDQYEPPPPNQPPPY